MSAEYSAGEVRAISEKFRQKYPGPIPGILNAYADLLERIKADEGAVPAVCIPFGHGNVVVTTGKHGGVPCVYLAPASMPGVVGESAARENLPRDKCVPGESILTFPTAEQAAIVAAALCGKSVHPPAQSAQVDVARFGHHPDPATDFCVEVEALLGEIENRRVGFENGTPSRVELDARIERALSFRVGGDPHAVMAKQQLRAATTTEPVAQGEDELCDCDADKYNQLPHHADCAALAALASGEPTPPVWLDAAGVPYGRVSDEQVLAVLHNAVRIVERRSGLGAVEQAFAVPDGMVLVPVEPTDAMCDAGDLPDTATAYDIYKAMLAAAPLPGESE